MPKITPIDRTSVLRAALVGFEMQRGRIDAAVREIQTELRQGSTRHSTGPATAAAEPKTPHKKRFSAAARKRMALAQKKRWAALKAKKSAVKAKVVPKTAPKSKARKPVSRPKAKTVADKRKKIAAKPTATIETAAVQVQAVAEGEPTTA